jgi:pimeloyl-ACP methyl ester carboxylesterase
MTSPPYLPRQASRSHFLDIRGLRTHILEWGDPAKVSAERPPLVMLHGWMDVAASFQFVVDALQAERHVLAFDWRGFGLTASVATADSYWYADYLADLDALLDMRFFNNSDNSAAVQAVDLLGHSMGGNAAMLYAGIRPQRIRRLVNLEGFGMPVSHAAQAPKRYAQWLDELKTPMTLRPYANLEAVARRLRKTNPLLPPERAAWLAQHWSRELADGSRAILGDPAHKRRSPLLYRVDEVLEIWKLISAPVLWVEGDQTDIGKWWGERYTKPEFHERLNVVAKVTRHTVAPAGHMLHHDQPEQLARLLEAFLDEA